MSAVSGASPDAYERHVGRYAKELSAGLIRVAGVRAGQSALDVGCGPGGLAVALAGLLGDENVAAVDPSERFVEVCRSRIPGADVRIGVAENLPFDDASFDAVLAQLVVQDIVDARNGVAEMRRVARPGGVVSGCVWDFESGMPLLRAAWGAALAIDAELARSLGADRRLPFLTPGRARRALAFNRPRGGGSRQDLRRRGLRGSRRSLVPVRCRRRRGRTLRSVPRWGCESTDEGPDWEQPR